MQKCEGEINSISNIQGDPTCKLIPYPVHSLVCWRFSAFLLLYSELFPFPSHFIHYTLRLYPPVSFVLDLRSTVTIKYSEFRVVLS